MRLHQILFHVVRKGRVSRLELVAQQSTYFTFTLTHQSFKVSNMYFPLFLAVLIASMWPRRNLHVRYIEWSMKTYCQLQDHKWDWSISLFALWRGYVDISSAKYKVLGTEGHKGEQCCCEQNSNHSSKHCKRVHCWRTGGRGWYVTAYTVYLVFITVIIIVRSHTGLLVFNNLSCAYLS